MTIELILSIVATILAVASFSGGLWRLWRDRPKFNFYIGRTNFTGLPDGRELMMMSVTISNVGYRPVIFTRFVALGESSWFSMGIHDEPAAIYGQSDQKFPILLEPGKSLKIHPLTIEAIKNNCTKPDSERVHFDPHKYYAFEDSFGHLHLINADKARFELGIAKRLPRPNWKQKPILWVRKKLFLRRARRRLQK